MKYILLMTVAMIFSGCAVSTKDLKPVTGFELEKYTGKWYEIARLPNRFEKGLSAVTAEYSPAKNDRIRVVNRGYSQEKDKWKRAEGIAYFKGDSSIGELKISFFRPFYGTYKIIDLDKDYQWAVVTSSTRKYLWILSRTPELAPQTLEHLLNDLEEKRFRTSDLVFPAYNK